MIRTTCRNCMYKNPRFGQHNGVLNSREVSEVRAICGHNEAQMYTMTVNLDHLRYCDCFVPEHIVLLIERKVNQKSHHNYSEKQAVGTAIASG